MPLGAQDHANLKTLNEAVELLRKLNSAPQGMSAEDRERVDRLQATIANASQALAERTTTGRAHEYDLPSREAHRALANLGSDQGSWVAMDAMLTMNTRDPEIVDAQLACDDAFIVMKLLNIPPMQQKQFRRRMAELPMLQRTISTGSDPAWIPTGFSNQMHELIRLQRRVSALHPRITMPTEPYKLPIEGADANSYLVAEQGEPDAELSASSRIANGLTPNAGLTNLTLSSRKIGTRVVFSEEIDEDSIIPIVPYFRGKVVRAFVDGEEDVTCNGDDGVTHMDTDTQALGATERRRAWKGHRRHTISSTRLAATTPTAISAADLRRVRASMGKYSINPNDLAWVTGPVGWHKMLSISEVMTVDKYGPNATLLSGELGRFDGIPIITSEFIRENLAATGFYDGVTTNRTVIELVRRDAFVYGDRRQARLRDRIVIETEQIVIAGTARLTMGAWFPGTAQVAMLTSIQP